MIRIALLNGAKIHFVSSISALSSKPAEDWLFLSSWEMNSKGGYAQSKVVSERLLYEAQTQYQVDVRVFRPGTISGDTRSGFSNLRDFTNLIIFTCITLKSAVRGSPFSLSWIPVDFVAKVICTISKSAHSSGKVFHITGDTPSL